MSRFAFLRQSLVKTGWAITEAEIPSENWWSYQIWIAVSDWSPKGSQIYASFLIDPQNYRPASGPVEADIWAISLTKTLPSDVPMADDSVVPLGPRFDQAMLEVVARAAALRDSFLM